MSVTAVAPPLALNGPFPVAPDYNLFTVARMLEGRWRAGVSLWAYPSDVPEGFDPCAEGTLATKGEGDDGTTALFDSFVAYIGEACSTLGMGPWEEFKGRVNAVLTATEAFAAERQLAAGAYLPSNPYVLDSNVTDLGLAANPAAGLAALEREIGLSGRQGVIHAPPAIASRWSFEGGLVKDGGRLETWLGTPVVVGHGYTDAWDVAEASGGSDLTNPAAGVDYAFATGPVVAGRADDLSEIDGGAAGSIDRTTNDVVYRAERDMLVAWDTVVQAAIRVDWDS